MRSYYPLFVVAALSGLLLSRAALAVLPPEVYKQAIRDSKVKAIAKVVEVKVVATSPTMVSKKVLFRLERSLGPEQPEETFVGHCESAGKKEIVGAPLFYYPKVGERVYVTLVKSGGSFTSYTLLTPELEEALLHSPEKVKPGIGEVTVKE